MNVPRVVRPLGLLVSLLPLACAGGGEDEGFSTFGSGTFTTVSTVDDEVDADAESDTGSDTSGVDVTTGDGDGDTSTTTSTTTGDGDGDTSTTTTTTTGDGDGDTADDCGNGVVDPGETCDGNNFNGASCMGLGYDGGALTCNANCAVDTSSCMNAAQPGLGQLYSNCLDSANCPGLDGCATVTNEGEVDPFDGYCTNLCTTDAECFANTGGTAVPQCNDEANSYCELDCSGGKTCPGGMDCLALVGGKELCY